MITISNTLSGKKEQLHTLHEKKVLLYVCGITPYDHAHVGHGRCYVSFDVLYRLLTFLGYEVIYCRNFTDIDDKLLRKAEQRYGDALQYAQVADEYITSYHDDMHRLNCAAPTHEPRVTDHIAEIINCVQELLDKGYAYEIEGDVYFSIAQFPSYGSLSKQKLEDLCAGQRVEVDSRKKDPLDFALWKSEPTGTFWKSPWGYGRPGWHIECSALARHYLGTQIDIHAGGRDLIFPHHENEIAQSESLSGLPFARYWMHNGFVQIHKEKMSKSLGNFFTLKDVFAICDPMVLRYYLLNHHYRAPLEFSLDDMHASERAYRKLIRLFASEQSHIDQHDIKKSRLVQQMLHALQDDLNTPALLGVLFDAWTVLQEDQHERIASKIFLQQVLGLSFAPLPEKEITMTPEIQQLIDERIAARAEKNWKKADEIRDRLRALGIEVHDTNIQKT